jgi:hypothetical protein
MVEGGKVYIGVGNPNEFVYYIIIVAVMVESKLVGAEVTEIEAGFVE